MPYRDFTTAETVLLDASGFASGLVGTIGYQIINMGTGAVAARVTTGITEPIAGSGIYIATLANPGDGRYADVWDANGIRAQDGFKVGTGVTTTPTLTEAPWPTGTSVSAYTTQGDQAVGPAVGPALATATVTANGTLTFTGLTLGHPYIAAALVNGSWVKVRFAA
jgi:hypothetical protein